jgi:excisionase family DNA binding protein
VNTMERLLLTPEEVAECLAICRAKVYELLRAGELRSVHIGASRRVPVSALHEFIEAHAGEAS